MENTLEAGKRKSWRPGMLVHPGYPGILGSQAQDVSGLD